MSFFSEIEILGHLVSDRGIKPHPDRVAAINNFGVPTNKKELQSFIGLVNYCRKFVKNISWTCKPLYDLLKKENSPTDLKNKLKTKEIIHCFEKIKREISNNTLLALPRQK